MVPNGTKLLPQTIMTYNPEEHVEQAEKNDLGNIFQYDKNINTQQAGCLVSLYIYNIILLYFLHDIDICKAIDHSTLEYVFDM